MTFLIVEDEYLILDFVCTEIKDVGLEALGATSADEALRVLDANPEITALVTDINMPGSMDGLQLAAEVRKRWPTIKIVVTSGRRRPLGIGVAARGGLCAETVLSTADHRCGARIAYRPLSSFVQS